MVARRGVVAVGEGVAVVAVDQPDSRRTNDQMKKLCCGALFALSVLSTSCSSGPSLTIQTPELAVQALVDASADRGLAEQLLGDGGFEMLKSGDEVADAEDLEAVRALIQQKVAFADDGTDRKLALLGDEGWELPIPLVAVDGRWSFDVSAGKEEILNRRIGRNELSTIATLRELVEAQREYRAIARDGRPAAYARRLWSTEGLHDGLYWPAVDGEPESPMGPLVAEAADEGYQRPETQGQPYHGYHFRFLMTQGAAAPGGARSYLDANDQLNSGFAVLAWPARHGNSGVMTFLVNHQGIVFQKDLGPDTAKHAAGMTAYDPDLSWTPTRD